MLEHPILDDDGVVFSLERQEMSGARDILVSLVEAVVEPTDVSDELLSLMNHMGPDAIVVRKIACLMSDSQKDDAVDEVVFCHTEKSTHCYAFGSW